MPSNAITVIHKFIRREMFDFSERLFRAEPDDVQAVCAALDKLIEILDIHSRQEDERIAPLLAGRDATLARRLARDHRRLDAELRNIRRAAQALDPRSPDCGRALHALHLDWNLFLSAYLAHLDDEERTLFAPIADRLPPIAALAEPPAGADPQVASEFRLRLWAVTTCSERIEIEQAEQRRRAAAEASHGEREDHEITTRPSADAVQA